MPETDERLRGWGFEDVARQTSDRASSSDTTGRFQVVVRGTISELNNDLMEKMHLLMTSFGGELLEQVDKRVKQAEELLSTKRITVDRRREAVVPQSSSEISEVSDAVSRLSIPSLSPQGPDAEDEKWLMPREFQESAKNFTMPNGERAKLITETRRLEAERDSFASRLAEKEKDRQKITRLEKKLVQSRTEIARLNSVMVQCGHPDEVLDDERLVQDYRNLLRTVDDIARSHYVSPIVRPPIPLADWSEDERQGQKKRYEERWAGWDQFSPEDRNHYVRSLIFRMLLEEFFLDPTFGLEGSMENGLVAFERALENDEMISRKDVIEWRRCTVAAALCHVRSTYPTTYLPRSVNASLWETRLWNTLLPVLTWTEDRRRPQGDCREAVSLLYDGALRFVLEMRRTRTVYRLIVPKEGDLVDESPNSTMQEISMGPQLAKGPSRIYFVLSAALVRDAITPSNTDRQYEVLEKAQVVGELLD